MNAKYLLILFLLPTPVLLNAQSNYKEGNVITNNGYTLKGFINYREWHKNPDKILFKTDLKAANAQIFTTDSIAGFTITGYESYARYILPVSMDEISFENLKEEIDSTTVTKAVFLKELLKGNRIDLFSYTDEIKVRFFILDKRQTIPYELVYRKLLKNGQEITQAQFQQQLSGLAYNYGVLTANLEDGIVKTNYSGRDIKNIISKINTQNETGNSAIIGKKRRWNFFVGAGITMSTMHYTGETLILVDGLDDMGRFKYKDKITTHSYLPRISAGADFYINPAIRRLIIRTEISATNIKSSVKSYYRYNVYTSEEEDTYRFATWNIGFSPQIIFNLYNTNNYKWYLGAGFLLNYFDNSKNSMERRDSQSGEFISINNEYLELREFAMNAIVRSGIRIYDRLDLSLIWTSPSEYTNYMVGRQSIKTSLLSFSVLYNLKK